MHFVYVVLTYEAVAAALVGLPVGYHDGLLDIAELLEVLAQRIICTTIQYDAQVEDLDSFETHRLDFGKTGD